MEQDEDEQPVEGEGLFLSLAHTACEAHPEDLLYPMDKKLLKGQQVDNTLVSQFVGYADPYEAISMSSCGLLPTSHDHSLGNPIAQALFERGGPNQNGSH